jgi:peptide/nickel transport system substrate-binding protein
MQYHRRRIVLLTLIVFWVSLTLGNAKSIAQIPEPVSGGKLVYAIPGTPDTLDPQMTSGTLTFQYIKSAYDTLIEPDESGNLVPALAESWQFSPENLTLTFQLRKSVKFHNGDTLTAADVKATFDRLLAPDSASPHKPKFTSVKDVRALDEHTVQFTLTRIYVPLISTLASIR